MDSDLPTGPFYIFLEEKMASFKEEIGEQPFFAYINLGLDRWFQLSMEERMLYRQEYMKPGQRKLKETVLLVERRYLQARQIKRFRQRVTASFYLKRIKSLNMDLIERVLIFI